MTTDSNGFGWTDALPPPNEFKLLPEGDAQFEVLKLERARREFGKLGTCNIADVTVRVASYADPDNPQEVDAALPLHPKVAFKLYQFFAALGLYQHGDVESGKPFRPDWSKVVGKCGLCTIKHRPWKGKDGAERKSAEIDAFLDDQGRTRASDKPRTVGAAEPSFD